MQEEVKTEAQEQEAQEAQNAETARETQEEAPAGEGAAKDETKAPEEPEVDPRDAEIVVLNNRLLRLQADFDNYRRRTNNEKEQLSAFVTANVVGSFLKILDNFERAEASAAKGAGAESLLKGLEQIRRQFDEAFKELGVTEIAAQGEKFDPNLHEAVMRGQNPELEDETIDMVLEKGYKLRDKVIRHSKVRVIAND